jgi:hypothetical protein
VKSQIATTDLELIPANGARRRVEIRIGAPTPTVHGSWQCHVELDGVDEALPPIEGDDSLQALGLALQFAALRVRHVLAQGHRLVHPGTDDDVSLEAYFGPVSLPGDSAV